MKCEYYIAQALSSDLVSLREIWELSKITLGASDTPEELERLRQRNESTCFVAIAGKVVVGGVLGGFDGRRGLVHHLAVHPSFRALGIGRRDKPEQSHFVM